MTITCLYILLSTYAVLVEANLAAHQLKQEKWELESRIARMENENEQLRMVNQELDAENESMSTSKKNQSMPSFMHIYDKINILFKTA